MLTWLVIGVMFAVLVLWAIAGVLCQRGIDRETPPWLDKAPPAPAPGPKEAA